MTSPLRRKRQTTRPSIRRRSRKIRMQDAGGRGQGISAICRPPIAGGELAYVVRFGLLWAAAACLFSFSASHAAELQWQRGRKAVARVATKQGVSEQRRHDGAVRTVAFEDHRGMGPRLTSGESGPQLAAGEVLAARVKPFSARYDAARFHPSLRLAIPQRTKRPRRFRHAVAAYFTGVEDPDSDAPGTARLQDAGCASFWRSFASPIGREATVRAWRRAVPALLCVVRLDSSA